MGRRWLTRNVNYILKSIEVDIMFEIGGGHGQGGIRDFLSDANEPAFLERELMGLGVDGYR